MTDTERSAREQSLIGLLAAGHTDASAARALGVSPRSVSSMVRSLMDRVGADNRFQLGLALGAREQPAAGAPGGADPAPPRVPGPDEAPAR